MIRYYDKKLRCEVFDPNENTLTSEDESVSFFFEELPQGKELKFTDDGIPFLEDIQEVSQEKIELLNKLSEAQFLLDSTQFKFGDDYDLKGTPEWEELRAKRQEAREFIRANKNV